VPQNSRVGRSGDCRAIEVPEAMMNVQLDRLGGTIGAMCMERDAILKGVALVLQSINSVTYF